MKTGVVLRCVSGVNSELKVVLRNSKYTNPYWEKYWILRVYNYYTF